MEHWPGKGPFPRMMLLLSQHKRVTHHLEQHLIQLQGKMHVNPLWNRATIQYDKQKFIWRWAITERTQIFIYFHMLCVFITEPPRKIPSLTQHPAEMVHMYCRFTKLQGKWNTCKTWAVWLTWYVLLLMARSNPLPPLPLRSTPRENTSRTGHYPAEWAPTIIRNISIARIRKIKSQSLLHLLSFAISKQEINLTFYFGLKTQENRVLKLATNQRVQTICKISLQGYYSLSL